MTAAFEAQVRSFYSWLLLTSTPFAIAGGWLFLVAGTGVYLIAAGLAMMLAGVLLRPSWSRAAAGASALAVGCAPFWALIAWIAFT
jgi:hypothetical protein